MVRTLVLAVVTLGVLALAAHDTYADCGQWYPFYGYRQPNYLAQPSVVYVQPAAPQAWTTYYAPAPGAAVPAPTVVPQYYYYAPPCNAGGGWHPFYGYRQPNLN